MPSNTGKTPVSLKLWAAAHLLSALTSQCLLHLSAQQYCPVRLYIAKTHTKQIK